MSDEQVIKRMMESKAEQQLRDSINSGKEFVAETSAQQKVLENYNNMDEAQKQQFKQKRWIND